MQDTHWDSRFLTLLLLLWFDSLSTAQEPAIQVTMNDDAKFVVSGENFSTLGIQFQSPSRSLAQALPDVTPTPFEFFLNNGPSEITIGSLGASAVIDGSVTLPFGWNSNGFDDLTFAYGEGPDIVGPFPIPAENYRGTCIDCVRPPLPPIQVGLSPEFNFTLTGLGHQLNAFEFVSEGASLKPASSPAPFASLAENTANRVRYEQLGDSVTLDGTITLDSGWSDFIGARDVSFSYEHVEQGNVVQSGPANLSRSAYPPLQNWPSVRAVFNSDSFAVLTGTGQPLRNYSLTSRSGSLIPGSDPGPFATVTGDANAVRYDAGPSNFVTLDGTLVLDTQWRLGEPESRSDVRTEYLIAGNPNPRFGSVTTYPREQFWRRIDVQLDDEDRFVITGSGQPLRRFDLTSGSGSLIPSEDLGPFTSFASNQNNFVSYEANENILLDGSITLGTKWDRAGFQDVRYEYDLDKVSRDVSGSVANNAYPRVPVCFDGRINELGISIDRRNRFVLEGDGHGLTTLSLSSASGSLVPGESAGPFASFGSNTTELVEFSSDGLVTINGTVVLSTGWNENAENVDVVADFGSVHLPSTSFRTCTDDPGVIGGGGFGTGFPIDGLFLQVVDDEIFLNSNFPVQISGLDLQSPNGSLVPVSEDLGPAPFAFFLSNTANQITWGNLGTTVTVNGSLNTGARYVGSNPARDIQASWGDGATPVAIPVFTGVIIPEPCSGLLLWTGLLIGLMGRRTRGTEQRTTNSRSFSEGRKFSLQGSNIRSVSRDSGGKRLTTFAMMISGLLAMLSSTSLAQDLVVTVNEDSKFVVTAVNGAFETFGLDFISPSGSLTPIPDFEGASPFIFFLANDSRQITYGNLGTTVSIDGDLTLEAGWNPNGTQDVSFSYGIGTTGEASDPFLLPLGAYEGICGNCSPITVDFDSQNQNQFVIAGLDHPVVDITFRSPSGSLRPGTDPGPFGSVVGTPESVTFTADGSLALNGSQPLDLQWGFGEIGSARDVTYTYRLADDASDVQRDFTVRSSLYPQRPPIAVRFNDENQFVLSGSGHPLSGLTLRSPSSSLVESDNSGPFETLGPTSASSITYSANTNPVVLDGEVTLPSGWAFGERNSQRDVTYSYELADDSLTFQGEIRRGDYNDEISWPRISFSLDEEDRFVLTGSGQPLQGLDLSSSSQSLIPAADIGPFDSAEFNTDGFISLRSEQNIVLDGTLTLQSKWDRKGDKDVRYVYDLDDVSQLISGTIPRSAYPSVPICRDGAVNSLGVSVNRRNQFVLSGNGQLMQLELASESGALVPGESAAPFASFDSNTTELVQFANGEFIQIDGLVVLSTEWNPDLGTRDVAVDFGPRPLTNANGPSCFDPNDGVAGGGGNEGRSGGLLAFIVDGEISIVTEGSPISAAGIDIVSAGGHLIPIESGDSSPFSFFLSNRENQMTWGNLGTNVVLDGEWRTGVGYTGTDPANDLAFSWGDGAIPVRFPVVVSSAANVSDTLVPEPNSSLLLMCGLLGLLTLSRRVAS